MNCPYCVSPKDYTDEQLIHHLQGGHGDVPEARDLIRELNRKMITKQRLETDIDSSPAGAKGFDPRNAALGTFSSQDQSKPEEPAKESQDQESKPNLPDKKIMLHCDTCTTDYEIHGDRATVGLYAAGKIKSLNLCKDCAENLAWFIGEYTKELLTARFDNSPGERAKSLNKAKSKYTAPAPKQSFLEVT